MREPDFAAFSALLDDVGMLLQPGQPLGPTAKAMYFRALAEHDLAAVRTALDAHVKDPQRGRWFPKPADLVAQLQGLAAADGRPGSDEAWAGSLAAADEATTVVWTDEMAQAWAAARPVFAIGDKIGARMAFREAYDRLVDEARKARRPAQWQACLGHDPRQRRDAIRQAVLLGKLPESDMLQLPETRGSTLLLELVGGSSMSEAERQGRAALRALRDRLATPPDEDAPGADGRAKLQTRAAQAAIAEQVQQHLAIGEPISINDLGAILSSARRAAGDGLAKVGG